MEELKVKAATEKFLGAFSFMSIMMVIIIFNWNFPYNSKVWWFHGILLIGFMYIFVELFYIFKTFIWGRENDVLIFTERGLIDRSMSASPGLIPWEEVKVVEVRGFTRSEMLGIKLDRHSDFFKGLTFYQRSMMLLNRLFRFPHVCIAVNRTDYTGEALRELTLAYKAYYAD